MYKTARVEFSKDFSADYLWFIVYQHWPALTSDASVLIQRSHLPENLWTVLIQLWSALKINYLWLFLGRQHGCIFDHYPDHVFSIIRFMIWIVWVVAEGIFGARLIMKTFCRSQNVLQQMMLGYGKSCSPWIIRNFDGLISVIGFGEEGK